MRTYNGQSLLFDRFKAFDSIESSTKSDFFSPPKRYIFFFVCAACSELPSNISIPGGWPSSKSQQASLPVDDFYKANEEHGTSIWLRKEIKSI